MKNTSVKLFGMCFALILVAGCAKINPKFEDSLNNAILAKTGDFENCYATTLQKKPKTAGEMQLKLAFTPSEKKVEKVEITASKIKDAGMKKCVVAVGQTIETTELPGTWVDGKYTLDFQAR